MATAMFKKAGVVEFHDSEQMIKTGVALSTQNPDYPHAIPVRALLRMTALDSEIMSLASGERSERRARLAAARSGRKVASAYG